MPSFVVTTATNEVSIDPATRRGTIPVTVSNISGRPVRVRLNLVPTPPAEAAWLSVQGEAEREFANGASGQFTAVVTVPTTVAAGTYTFKPVAAAEDRPMEEFTEGPTLSVKVEAARQKKPFPWWLVGVAAGVVVLAVLIVTLVGGGDEEEVAPTTAPTVTTLPPAVQVRVPNVTGERQANAKAEIEAAGLVAAFVIDQTKAPQCNGPVISQSPSAGSMVAGGSSVFLLIPAASPPVQCIKLPTVTLVDPRVLDELQRAKP